MEKVKVENAKELKEVYEILKFFPENELNKISKKFLNYIKEYKDDEYEFEWSVEKVLDYNTVLPGTITLMQMIFMNYFATDEEKKEINEILDKNERIYQEELHEKYNPDNLFEKNSNSNKNKENSENNLQNHIKDDNKAQMVIYKENIFKRIINSILNLFRRKK